MRLYGWCKRTETLFVLVNRRPGVYQPGKLHWVKVPLYRNSSARALVTGFC